MMENRPAEVINNTAGDMFDPGVYWEDLHTVGDAIDESIMNVEGVTFELRLSLHMSIMLGSKVDPPRKITMYNLIDLNLSNQFYSQS